MTVFSSSKFGNLDNLQKMANFVIIVAILLHCCEVMASDPDPALIVLLLEDMAAEEQDDQVKPKAAIQPIEAEAWQVGDGDGKGKLEAGRSLENKEDCLQICIQLKKFNSKINGATFGIKNGEEGTCYCELEMTGVDSVGNSANWITRLIQVKEKSACEPNPCSNGGACYGGANNRYRCRCPDPWTGPHCDDDVCAKDQRQNCEKWSKKGYCTDKRRLRKMKKVCSVTCGFCDGKVGEKVLISKTELIN